MNTLWLLTIYWGLMKQNDLSVQETETLFTTLEHTNEILNSYELATISPKHTKLADMNNCLLLPCFNSWSDSGVVCRSTKSKCTVETNTSTRLWNPYQGLHTQGCNVFAPSMSPSVHHNTLKRFPLRQCVEHLIGSNFSIAIFSVFLAFPCHYTVIATLQPTFN